MTDPREKRQQDLKLQESQLFGKAFSIGDDQWEIERDGNWYIMNPVGDDAKTRESRGFRSQAQVETFLTTQGVDLDTTFGDKKAEAPKRTPIGKILVRDVSVPDEVASQSGETSFTVSRTDEDRMTGIAERTEADKLKADGFHGRQAESDPMDRDELYGEAVALVADTRKASTTMLQKRLRIGYNRAARMMEDMEGDGIVGPADGFKPRQIFIEPGGKIHFEPEPVPPPVDAEAIGAGLRKLLEDVPGGDPGELASPEDVDATMQTIQLQKVMEVLRKIPVGSLDRRGPKRDPDEDPLKDFSALELEKFQRTAEAYVQNILNHVEKMHEAFRDSCPALVAHSERFFADRKFPGETRATKKNAEMAVALIQNYLLEFSNIIRKITEETGLSLSEVAREMNVDAEGLRTMYETGSLDSDEDLKAAEIADLKGELAGFLEPSEVPDFDQPTSPLGKIGEWDKAYFESRIEMTPFLTKRILSVKKLEQFQADVMKISGRVDRLKNAFLAVRKLRDHGLDQEFQDILMKDLDRECEADLGRTIRLGIEGIPENVSEGGRKKAKSYIKSFGEWLARAEKLEERYRTFLSKVVEKENEARSRINDIQNRLLEFEGGERADYPLVPMLKSDGTEESPFPELWAPPSTWEDRIAKDEVIEEDSQEGIATHDEELEVSRTEIIMVGDIKSYLDYESNWGDVDGAKLVLGDGREFDVVGVERDDFDEDEIVVVVRTTDGNEEEFPTNILGDAKIVK